MVRSPWSNAIDHIEPSPTPWAAGGFLVLIGQGNTAASPLSAPYLSPIIAYQYEGGVLR